MAKEKLNSKDSEKVNGGSENLRLDIDENRLREKLKKDEKDNEIFFEILFEEGFINNYDYQLLCCFNRNEDYEDLIIKLTQLSDNDTSDSIATMIIDFYTGNM